MGVVKDTDVARRIARAVVSDIALYNPKKVEEGRGAVSVFPPVRFPGPPSEPDVHVSAHPALREIRPSRSMVWGSVCPGSGSG